MTYEAGAVVGGVDTHKHTHHAAVIDQRGQLLGDREFRTSAAAVGILARHMLCAAVADCATPPVDSSLGGP